ncbi:hypothetical protein GDO78_020325 [Eleutherodactylus coqui]|uniref:Uncharacterized protein n=1 Tax=Eleutherodactylus coqui TaxID=57060 RepID=A0A8J6E8K9_ELECQ|nr:hypothetical protein GDO78_020325 [Eleutherodactylus coqui]
MESYCSFSGRVGNKQMLRPLFRRFLSLCSVPRRSQPLWAFNIAQSHRWPSRAAAHLVTLYLQPHHY